MVREPRKGIRRSLAAYLIEQLGVIEQSSAQNNRVAYDHAGVSQHGRSVQMALRLAHRDVGDYIQGCGNEQRPVERRIRAA